MGRRATAAKRSKAGQRRRAGGTAVSAPRCKSWCPEAGPPRHVVERQIALQLHFAEQRQVKEEAAPADRPLGPAARAGVAEAAPSGEPVVLPFRKPEPASPPPPLAEPAPHKRPAVNRPLFSQRQIAVALLLLPSILTGAFVSFIASRRDAPVPAPDLVAVAKSRPPPIERQRPIDFAAILPAPALPTRPPAIEPSGEIRFATLRLPDDPPHVVASSPTIDLPPPAFALADAVPEVNPSAAAADVAVPTLPITIASLPAAPQPALSALATVALAPIEQCVAEAGFTLLANPKLPAPAGAPLDETPEQFGVRLAEAARAQTASLVIYNARYSRIAYPGGDVSPFYGVCTDVVVRAYRSLGIDLQIDVAQAGVGTGDRNIDHRRTEVMRKFLAKRGESLAISDNPDDYKPGDIVTYYRPQNRSSTAHIAIVSDVVGPSGQWMIVHNRGWGVQLEDALFVDKITGHYRYRGGAKPTDAAIAARNPKPALPAKQAVVAAGDTPRIKPKTPGGSTLAKAGAAGRALP